MYKGVILEYLGFYIESNGKLNWYQDHDGQKWTNYQDLIPGTINFSKEHWGKGFMLSNWVPCYDWVSHDGYNNFATWVEKAI